MKNFVHKQLFPMGLQEGFKIERFLAFYFGTTNAANHMAEQAFSNPSIRQFFRVIHTLASLKTDRNMRSILGGK